MQNEKHGPELEAFVVVETALAASIVRQGIIDLVAERLVITCRDCGDESEQLDGPVMAGFLPRCADCGDTRLVTITELIETDPPGMDLARPDIWEIRELRAAELAGTCECGGRFASGAPIRCAACWSTHVDSVNFGSVD